MPTEAAATAAAAAAAPTTAADDVEWEELYSEEHSRAYWQNVATREVTWEPQETATQVLLHSQLDTGGHHDVNPQRPHHSDLGQAF